MAKEKESMLKKILRSYKELPRNLTQKHRFKKEIKTKAFAEADKIADEKIKDKDLVSNTKIPWLTAWSRDPGLMSEERKKEVILRRSIRKKKLEQEMKKAKEKGII